MPYADPERQKEYNRRKYRERPHLWKNPDGTWKKSSSDHRASQRRHYEKNKEKILERGREKTRQKREERTGPCPICETETVLVWDHDHATGLFRAYICSPCNLSLGHAKDNPTTLRRLADYLERTTST